MKIAASVIACHRQENQDWPDQSAIWQFKIQRYDLDKLEIWKFIDEPTYFRFPATILEWLTKSFR